MADDLLPVLTRFHREFVQPEIQRAFGEMRAEMNARFAEQDAHFDAIYQRLDRLETEYHMLVAGLKRVEERLDTVEQRLAKQDIQAELAGLKARVDGLQSQIRILEDRLSA